MGNDWAHTFLGTIFLAVCCLGFALLALFVYRYAIGRLAVSGGAPFLQKRKHSDWVFLAFLVALAARITLASVFIGHNDITFFRYWAVQLQKDFFSFYDGLSSYSYLPAYHYILYLVGLLARLLGIPYTSGIFWVMLKLPSIVCDLVCAYLIYKISLKYLSPSRALAFCLLYLFNPAVFINSSMWGQVDSFLALFTILCVQFALERKYIQCLAVIGAALSFKLQFAFILPVVAAFILKDIVKSIKSRDYRIFSRLAIGFAAMVGAFLLLTLPLTIKYMLAGKPFFFIEVYLAQMGAYDYFSVNAFNFYSLIFKNWQPIPDTLIMGFLSYEALNFIVIALLSLLCMALCWKAEDKHIYLCCALLVLAVFTFSMEMHERYMFAALPLLLLSAAATRDNHVTGGVAAFSILQFLNCGLLLTRKTQYFTSDDLSLFIFSNLWVFYFLYFAIAATFICLTREKPGRHPCEEQPAEDAGKFAEKEQKASRYGTEQKNSRYDQRYERKLQARRAAKLGRKDLAVMAALFAAYFAFNLINLGGLSVPRTFWEVEDAGEFIVLEIPAGTAVGEIWGYKGIDRAENSSNSIKVYAAENIGEDYSSIISPAYYKGERKVTNNGGNGTASMYKWFTVKELDGDYRYVAFTCSRNVRINEIVLLEKGTRKVIDYTVAYASSDGIRNAFDERHTFPGHNSLMTDMYFDEIYHARTAFEHIMGWQPYEITHPPLGKIIISVGIRIFGMNPFGWRISGVLFSSLLLPVIYAMGRLLFKKRAWALVFSLLFALDGLHFVQGRIATIDTYSVFFSSLAVLFMLWFYNTNILRDRLESCLIPFALSGVMFGFSIATKWTGFYIGAGLFVIFIIYLVKAIDEYRYKAAATEDGKELKEFSKRFDRAVAALFASGLAFFVVIPFAIYLLSYIPYLTGQDKSLASLIRVMIDNQFYMYSYHSKWVVGTSHQCESPWYTWPLNWRSVYMYMADGSFGKYARIHSMGNHAISWAGIAALAFCAWRVMSKPAVSLLNRINLEKREIYIEKRGKEAAKNAEKKFRLRQPRPLEDWERQALFVPLIGFLAAMLPWTLVERSTFIYHFYPAMPFICAMITFSLMSICKKFDKQIFSVKLGGRAVAVTAGRLVAAGYLFACALFFAMLYPAFAGIPVSYEYAYVFRWLNIFGRHVGF